MWGHRHEGMRRGGGCRARAPGAVPGTEGQRTLWWHCHPRRLDGRGEGRGGDRDMGAPEGPGHGGPGVAPYLQGLGDTDMCGAVGSLFWGMGQPQGTHVWGSWGHGGPGGCRDRGFSGGPGDMGGPRDPAGGEG